MSSVRCKVRSRAAALGFGLLLCALVADPALAGPLDTPVVLALPAQSLGDSLRALAKASQLQILVDAELVTGRSAAALSGTLAPRAALETLLRGTNLEAYEQAPGVVVIRRRP